jgi:hypothetical protein
MRPHDGLPAAAFGKNFLTQFAGDAGFGLRFNLTVLILRTDFGFPLFEPAQKTFGVVDGVNYDDAKWRGSNMVFNLAIGYPF